eukprot:jgi/Mesvir1/13432/Mv16505-RA.1
MDVEAKQSEVLEQFCLLAKGAKGRALVQLIHEATSHPDLFAFGELLDVPSIAELEGTEFASSLHLLRLFAHGTWKDYTASPSSFPELTPKQLLKLRQLSVMSLAAATKLLPYDTLLGELGMGHVRELEDLLINDGIYKGILKGRLDQMHRIFEVHQVVGRDLRPGQLQEVIQTISSWLKVSEELMESIRARTGWAAQMGEQSAQHREAVEAQVEEMRKVVKAEQQQSQGGRSSDLVGHTDGSSVLELLGMGMDEERGLRPKRRR